MAYLTIFMMGVAAGYLLSCFMAGAKELDGRADEGCSGNCKCKINESETDKC
jgi:hypothetical protein